MRMIISDTIWRDKKGDFKKSIQDLKGGGKIYEKKKPSLSRGIKGSF